MLQSNVNHKALHAKNNPRLRLRAKNNPRLRLRATVDSYEFALDSGMDFIEPETPEPRELSGLARSERKFGVQVVGILDKKHVNGYYRAKLLCLDGSEYTNAFRLSEYTNAFRLSEYTNAFRLSEFTNAFRLSEFTNAFRLMELEADISISELNSLPELRQKSAFDEWQSGGYPVEPVIESAFHKLENKDKLASCVLCGRTLTHPLSIKRHIGPECFKRVTSSGNTFIEGDEVTQGLIRASEAYSEARFQKWIIRAVLTLDAPFPDTTLEWLGNEYFGYSNKPSLYYLDTDKKLNCIEVRKNLIHRQITSLSTCESKLDCHAWGMYGKKEEQGRKWAEEQRSRGADEQGRKFLIVLLVLTITFGRGVKTNKKIPNSEFRIPNSSVALVFREVEVEDLGPYLKGQWLFFEGNTRTCIYLEKNGQIWCTCHQPNCKHLRMLDKNRRCEK